MNVYGVEITKEQEDVGLAAMKDGFVASDVEKALEVSGVPRRINERCFGGHLVSHRAADRLIQRERRKGNIRFNKETRKWERVKR